MLNKKLFILILFVFGGQFIFPASEFPLSDSNINSIIKIYISNLSGKSDRPNTVQTEKIILNKAKNYLKDNNYKKVINIIYPLLKKNPGSAIGNKLFGIAYFETGKIEKAKKYFDKALYNLKNDALIFGYLGSYYEIKENFKYAIAFYYSANKKEKDILTIEKIGKIYRKLKFYPEALIWFNKAKKISNSENIAYEKALTYFYLKVFDYALLILKKYIKNTTNGKICELYAKIL